MNKALFAVLAWLLCNEVVLAQFPGGPAAAQRDASASEFIILGTASGPVSEATRAQPSNVLLAGGNVFLVDAGDGAVAQLAKAGISLARVNGVFLSHLHFDHTAGMLAVIGLRMQLENQAPLTIFGPAGTREFIQGLLAAAAPAMRAGYGIPGQSWQANVEVIELFDGDTTDVGPMHVRVVENSHFSMPEGSDEARPASSLSYRFDLPDRSIVYTGDTGPSAAVAMLADNVDLLVSEMIDIDTVLSFMRPPGSPAPGAVDAQTLTGFPWHMYSHHMTPVQVGELAAMANVARLVVTHFAPNPQSPEQAQQFLDAIAENYSGNAELGSDLGRY